MLGGAGDGRPAIDTDEKMAEAILSFSGTTNGELAVQGFRTLGAAGRASGSSTSPRARRRSGSPSPTPRSRPVPVITSPEWSGSETGGRRYAPFTVNIERLKPFHTLTGRMHFYLDHDWMLRPRRGAADLPAAAGHAPAASASRRSDRTARSR